MRAIAGVVVALCLVASGCADGTGAGRETRTVTAAMTRTEREPHAFVYTEITEGRQVRVRGEKQDDFRRSVVVSVDERDLLRQVMSDDAVALQLLDPDGTPELVTAVGDTGSTAASALAEGEWVVDYTAAPPVVPERGVEEVGIGADPFLDSMHLFHYVRTAIRKAAGMVRFNPEGIEYNPLDDPWRDDAERDLEGRGIRRYDLIPPPLPRRSERGTQQALPNTEHFRKMAFYVRGQYVVEVREQIDIDDRREFRRAEEGRAPQYFLELRDKSRRGFTQEPVRERVMTYRVIDLRSDLQVQLPLENVTVTSLGPLFGPEWRAAVTGEQPDADATRPMLPGLPEGVPPAGQGPDGVS